MLQRSGAAAVREDFAADLQHGDEGDGRTLHTDHGPHSYPDTSLRPGGEEDLPPYRVPAYWTL